MQEKVDGLESILGEYKESIEFALETLR